MREEEFSKIHDLWINIPNYVLDHGSRLSERFVGRRRVLKRLRFLLSDQSSQGGAYLLTGYRGTGKTKLINEVLNDIGIDNHEASSRERKNNHSKNKTKRLEIRVALSQDEIQDIDLLKQIAKKLSLLIEQDKDVQPRTKFTKEIVGISRVVAFGFGILICSFVMTNVIIPDLETINKYKTILFASGIISVFLLHFIIRVFLNIVYLKTIPNIKRIELKEANARMLTRLYGRTTVEQLRGERESRTMGAGGGIIPSITSLFGGESTATTSNTSYTSFGTKELEYAIQDLAQLYINVYTYYGRHLPTIGKVKPPNNSISRLQLYIVIDELDKVEPEYYNETETLSPKKRYDSEFRTKTRMRQEAISKLLANLKNFLNSCPAKFVFIGGRGMYDAALADISDRESFYSSIFHEVLYTDSFFKDKLEEKAGISQLTETFLVNVVLGRKSLEPSREDSGLRSIEEIINVLFDQKSRLKGISDLQLKTAHMLQNFVGYLAFRSNGTPKKLNELVEKYIHYTEEIRTDPFNITVLSRCKCQKKPCNCNLSKYYLRFTYKDQYEINLTNSFYRPYAISGTQYLKTLGDKLLYSTAFLIDHILKFHRTSFTFQDLELIPDIILTNHDPNFRYFLNELLQFMLSNHLRKTVNGLNDYKFVSKTSNELRFLSKTSESSSAALNFSLDESYHLKSYYRQLLTIKKSEYEKGIKPGNSLVHSISYLQATLGDLHFYDQKYRDAIISYTDAIQPFREYLSRESPSPTHQLVLYTRNKLKLGHAIERQRDYTKASSIYRSLTLELKKLKDHIPKGKSKSDGKSKWEMPYRRMSTFMRPHIALLAIYEKSRQDGLTHGNLVRNFYEYISFLGLKTGKIFPTEHITECLEYQKLKPKKITYSDSKRVVTLIVDYFTSVGSILFYKNQLMYRLLFLYENEEDKLSQYIRNKIDNKGKPYNQKASYRPAHSAYLYYTYALRYFIEPYLENFQDTAKGFPPEKYSKSPCLIRDLKSTTYFIHNETYSILGSEQKQVLANILSKLADALLACISHDSYKKSCIKNKFKNEISELYKLRYPYATGNYNIIAKKYRSLLDSYGTKKYNLGKKGPNLALVFTINDIAAYFARGAGNKNMESTILEKSLHLIRNIHSTIYFTHTYKNKTMKLNYFNTSDIEPVLLRMFRNITDKSAAANRDEINKYQHLHGWTEEVRTNIRSRIYKLLSTGNEIKRLNTLYDDIFYRTPNFNSNWKLSSHDTVSSMLSRAQELIHQGTKHLSDLRRYNFIILINNQEQIINPIKDSISLTSLVSQFEIQLKAPSNSLHPVNSEEFSLFIDKLSDCLFCLIDSIRILKIYGINYIFNHSYIRRAYKKTADACILYTFLDQHLPKSSPPKTPTRSKATGRERLEATLSGLLGPRYRFALEEKKHLENALKHYDHAIEVHSEGDQYRELIQQMYFLDDDYSDNFTHFCVALERFRINTYQLRRVRKNIDERLKNTKLYTLENYELSSSVPKHQNMGEHPKA